MITVNYALINKRIDELLKKYKNVTDLYQCLAMEMGTSSQNVYRLIAYKKLNTLKQLNTLSLALGISVKDLIIIADEEQRSPITEIY